MYQVLTLIFYLVTSLVLTVAVDFNSFCLTADRYGWLVAMIKAHQQMEDYSLMFYVYVSTQYQLSCGVWRFMLVGTYSRVQNKTGGNLILFWMFFHPTRPYSELLVYWILWKTRKYGRLPANFLTLWVWEGTGAIQDDKYLKWQ